MNISNEWSHIKSQDKFQPGECGVAADSRLNEWF